MGTLDKIVALKQHKSEIVDPYYAEGEWPLYQL